MDPEPDINAERLIALVAERPVLWDRSHEQYQSRIYSMGAWKSVCENLVQDYQKLTANEQRAYETLAMKKWRNIKDQWIKSMKKISTPKHKTARKYIYHEQLSFLQKTLAQPNYAESNSNDAKGEEEEEEVDYSVFQNITVDVKPAEFTAEQTLQEANFFTHSKPVNSKKRKVQEKVLSDNEDRHTSFFRSLLPSLQELNDDEILEFQAGTINLVQHIKNKRKYQGHLLFSPHKYQSTDFPQTFLTCMTVLDKTPVLPGK